MRIEINMNFICNVLKNSISKRIGINIRLERTTLAPEMVRDWEDLNSQKIAEGFLNEKSHLQQGIVAILGDYADKKITLQETPYLYPSTQILEKFPDLTGPITGNLSNCYDPKTKDFLFHMRGKDISAPFGFQAAAAGMGRFREHPQFTARRELTEEADLSYAETLFYGNAIDCLPFMKAGKIPQPLFSFGFANDLSRFPFCRSLDDIAEFEEKTKQSLQENTLEKKEAYHFTIPYENIEEITGELNGQNRFYGPIYDSTINFIRILKDYRMLD